VVMDFKPADRDELHKALGAAMTNWQYVETGLYVIAHCILATDQKLSAIAFFHIKSADVKLTLVDKLCTAAISPTILAEVWKPLRKTIQGHITTRNYLAHYEASWFDLSSAQGATQYPIMIAAHHLQPAPGEDAKVTVLFVEELREMAKAYTETTGDLLRFAVTHCPNWTQQSESLPPRLQQALQTFHRTGTAEEPAPPPEPSQA
jgi:hypothetical protein